MGLLSAAQSMGGDPQDALRQQLAAAGIVGPEAEAILAQAMAAHGAGQLGPRMSGLCGELHTTRRPIGPNLSGKAGPIGSGRPR